MSVDLDALSREVAAAGDGWMRRGVSGVTPDGRLWLWTGSAWIDDDYMPASEEEGDDDEGQRWFSSEVADIWPHLHNPVTVNALLEDRQVYANAPTGGEYWLCYPASEPIGGKSWLRCDTRTEAICRAWIAARGKGNGN